MATYAHPEMLVSTDWVTQHLTDPKVKLVEVDVDTKSYDEGHVPNAIAWAWNTQPPFPLGCSGLCPAGRVMREPWRRTISRDCRPFIRLHHFPVRERSAEQSARL